MRSRFDLAVIGTGPAGQKAAINAAKMGKHVVIIERQSVVGGACLHTGTIPSKAVREAILHLTGFRMRGVYGTSYQVKKDITISDLIFRCEQVIRHEVDVIQSQMQRNNVELRIGCASFVDANTLWIVRPDHAEEITAENIIIATGTVPAHPSHIPFEPGRVIDSDGILQLEEVPSSMIIVGGGVIGVEYACMMAVLGVRVTLIDQRPRLLEFLDAEIAEALQFHMRSSLGSGVRLRLGEAVSEVETTDHSVVAVLDSGKRIEACTLLFSIGRQGATADLNLEAAGISADERGRIRVDEHLRTGVPHIFAAGDVIGFPALASTSGEQGRLASCNALGTACENRPTLMPYGIFTIPEISMVGPNEEQLTADQVPYEVGIARYREIARGQLLGDQDGMLKLLFHRETRQLLGVHVLGVGATELVHIGQAVMALNGTINYFVEAVFNYPTLAECYKVAALDGINRASSSCLDVERPGVPAGGAEAAAAPIEQVPATV